MAISHETLLLDSLTDAVFSLDAEWRYTYINAAAEKLVNRARGDVIGRCCWELYPGFRGQRTAAQIDLSMKERVPVVWEAHSELADKWTQWRAYPMPDGGVSLFMHDIDARVRAEQAQRESERRFQAIADLVPAIIWVTTTPGVPQWVNQRWLTYVGLTREQASQSIDGSIHPEDRDSTREVIRAATEAGRAFKCEHRIRRADGAYRWFVAQAQPITDANGSIEQWVSVALDIQEQRDAIASAQAARADAQNARTDAELERERLARLLEQAPFAVSITTGANHLMKSANAMQRRLVGPRLALDLPLRVMFPEPEMQGVQDVLDCVFSTGETVVMREQPIGWDRDGTGQVEHGYFDVIYQPIRDVSGKPEGVMSFTVEVTVSVTARLAEAKARAEAENAREHLRSILSAIPNAVAVTLGKDHVFEFVNEAYRSFSGNRELLGWRLNDVFPETRDSELTAILDRVLRTGATTAMPERRVVYDRQQNGSVYEGYFSTFFGPLRSRDGSIQGVVSSALEVTDQVRQRAGIQALRQEAEKARAELECAHAQLEERIKERTQQLATSNAALADEIAVRIQAEANRNEMQRRLATAREDEQRRTARDLHDQVGQTLSALMLAIKAACEAETLPRAATTRLEDALRLAEDLGRDVHELATRLRPAVLDEFGLHAGVRQLLTQWSRRTTTQVDFEGSWLHQTRLPPDIETVLYRVIQEALTNIARHAHAAHVSVVIERDAGHVIAVVEDDGAGFDASAASSGRLGLVGMRERATQVGGELEIESSLGRGTTVYVRVPLGGPA